LNKGARPTLTEFKDRVHHRNLDHLSIWHNVGRDVDNGIWAIAGARMGTYMTMITPQWDFRNVQDFGQLEQLWSTVADTNPELLAGRVAEDLTTQLDLPINTLLGPESAFFKQHYRSNWHNQGVMIREIDIIRQQEGW
jgi:hypothetical protein